MRALLSVYLPWSTRAGAQSDIKLMLIYQLQEALKISQPDRAAFFNVLIFTLDTSNVVYKKYETCQTKIASEPHFRLPLLLPIYFEVWVGLSRLRSVSYHHPSS